MKKIVLISCVKKKLPYKAKAEHLYISPLFKGNLRYARSLKPDSIFILSAKHGLLELDAEIEPYNSTLKDMSVVPVKDRSIFRKNIGRAILNKDQDAFLEQWEIDLTTGNARQKYAGKIDQRKLQETEKRVTEYIRQNFRFVVFRVDDRPKRLCWESKIISTVSQCDECRPSQNWLGLHSPKEKIQASGLWLVNELYKQPLSESDYEALKMAVLSSA